MAMSDHFPITLKYINEVTTPQVISFKKDAEVGSLKGRGICLVHLIATPLKAISKVGEVGSNLIETIALLVKTITLNKKRPGKSAKKVGAKLFDSGFSLVVAPVALLANVVRGVAGTFFHPAAMIKGTAKHGSLIYPFIDGILRPSSLVSLYD